MKKMLVVSLSAVVGTNRRLYEEFSDKGYEIRLLVPYHIKDSTGKFIYCEPEQYSKCKLVKTHLYFNNPRYQYYKGMIRQYLEFKPDILYLENDPHCIITFMFVLAQVFHRTEISCFTHENYERSFSYSYKHFGFKGIINALFILKTKLFVRRFIKNIFVESNDSVKIFTDWKYKNVVKVPLGIDTDVFKVETVTRNKIRNELNLNKITFGYFGRISPEKGVDIILKSLLKIKDLEWQFVINEFEVKNSYGKQIGTMLIEYGLKDRTTRVKTTHNKIASYMNATDIVILHSNRINNWKEQYGRVAAEAMACGNVVIVSDNGTLPEIVANDDLVIRQYDADGLAKKLREIISDEKLRLELKNSLHVRAHSELSIKKQVELTLKKL